MTLVTSGRVSEADRRWLERAVALAWQARERGDHPFGALLVLPGGGLLEALNSVVTGGDPTGHAETNLVRLAGKADRASLSGSVLYTSTEPCAMCAGAIYWSGIGRVVFALSELSLRAIASSQQGTPTMNLPCRTVFAAGRRATTVLGPAIESEAATPHHGFWH